MLIDAGKFGGSVCHALGVLLFRIMRFIYGHTSLSSAKGVGRYGNDAKTAKECHQTRI